MVAVHPRPAALAQRMSAAPAGRHGRMRDGEYGAAGPQVPPSRTWWAPAAASSQQPAAAASSTGLRDTREGGERGARGGSSAGGQPEGGPCPSGRPHAFPAAMAWARWCWLLPGGALLLLPGPCAGDSGSATRSCAAAEGARRPSRPLACQGARPHSPGGVADLGGTGGRGGSEARCTIAVESIESKIGVDLGGFFAVFAVAIWRWGKSLKFNVENSASAPWLLSARQKLA